MFKIVGAQENQDSIMNAMYPWKRVAKDGCCLNITTILVWWLMDTWSICLSWIHDQSELSFCLHLSNHPFLLLIHQIFLHRTGQIIRAWHFDWVVSREWVFLWHFFLKNWLFTIKKCTNNSGGVAGKWVQHACGCTTSSKIVSATCTSGQGWKTRMGAMKS